MNVKTAEELYKHKNDVVEVNSYEGVMDFLLRRKLRGRLDFPTAYEDEGYWESQLYLICGVTSDRTGGFYRFFLMKEGKGVKDIEDEGEREFVKKGLITPEDIRLVKCHHFVAYGMK